MNKKYDKALVITTAILFITVSAFGVIKSINKSKVISKSYQADVTLTETVVFDDQSIIDVYGNPLTFEKGTTGEIWDVIDSYGEKHGYKHISAWLASSDGQKISVILASGQDAEKDHVIIQNQVTTVTTGNGTDVKTKTNTFSTVAPVIDINKIENAKTVFSEFNQIKETYYQEVRQTVISGSIITAIIAVILVSVFLLLNHIFRNDTFRRVLVIVLIVIDVVMTLSAALEFYFSAWY